MPLYVCGSAYSFDHGWVEGALDTSEQVVERLGVEPPESVRPWPTGKFGWGGAPAPLHATFATSRLPAERKR